jgi:hypothetical protein
MLRYRRADLNTASGLRLMKSMWRERQPWRGLAQAIMDARLRTRLRVLLPIVENVVSAVHRWRSSAHQRADR